MKSQTFFWYKRQATRYILPFMCPEMTIDPPFQGRSQEETTTEANTRSVVRNQPYEIF